MAYNVTLIPGDGTGPEISVATRRVLEATGVKFNWELAYAGAGVIEEQGTPLPEAVIESIRKNRVAIKGPVTTPVGTGFRSVNVALRKALDLYACVRPCKTYDGVPSPLLPFLLLFIFGRKCLFMSKLDVLIVSGFVSAVVLLIVAINRIRFSKPSSSSF